jgi:hypothetical protein
MPPTAAHGFGEPAVSTKHTCGQQHFSNGGMLFCQSRLGQKPCKLIQDLSTGAVAAANLSTSHTDSGFPKVQEDIDSATESTMAPKDNAVRASKTTEPDIDRDSHPVDIVERFANDNEWSFDRPGEDEIALSVAGKLADYQLSFSWMEDFEVLHLACAFDLAVPEARSAEVYRLLSRINEQMLFGHFDVWEGEGAIMYRQTLLLAGGAEPTLEQVEMLLMSALDSCENYFPAFQYVIWSGVTAAKALDSVMFETHGTA